MGILILNKQEELQAILSNVNPGACPFEGDLHIQSLNDGLALHEFTVPADHPDAESIEINGYSAIEDYRGGLIPFRIRSIVDERDGEGVLKRTVYAENAGLELLDTVSRPAELTGQSAEQALQYALSGTRWQVGTVEWSGTKDVTIGDFQTALKSVIDIVDLFGGEVRFRVEVEGSKIVNRYVDILKTRGEQDGWGVKRFECGKDLDGVVRTESADNLVTALVVVGKNDSEGNKTTIEGIEETLVNDNGVEVTKPLGQDWVGDPDALQRWGIEGNHRFGIYRDENETNPNALITAAWNRLQTVKYPKMDYKMKVVLLRKLAGYEDEEVRLGDKVTVIDKNFNPAVTLTARVTELEVSQTDPDDDSVKLGNFEDIELTDYDVIERLQKLVYEKQSEWDKKIHESNTPPANPYDGQLWLDTTNEPNVLKRWDDSDGAWVKATPTVAAEVGAVTAEEAMDLSKAEKLRGYKITVYKEKTAMDDRYDQIIVNPAMYTTSVKDELQNAKSDLDTKYNALVSEIDSVTSDDTVSDAEQSNFETKESDYRSAVARFETAMVSAHEDISAGRASDAQDAATDYTETYANKKIARSSTAPANPVTDDLWIDTSLNPSVWKQYNGSSWEKIERTDLSELTGQVNSGQIEANAVTVSEILDGAIEEAKLASGAVTELKLGNNAVTNGKLADLAVDANKLADSSVTTTKIANLAVGTAAIEDGAITNAKIDTLDAGKITTGRLDAGRIQIGSGTQFDSGFDPTTKETPAGAQSKADTAESQAKTYTDNNAEKKRVESDTAPGDTAVLWIDTSVTPNIVKYHNGSSWEKLAPTQASEVGAETPSGAQSKADSAESNAKSFATSEANTAEQNAKDYRDLWAYQDTTYIDGGNIYANSVTANEIAAGTITANEVATRTLTADRFQSGTITANELGADSVGADQIAANVITSNMISTAGLDAGVIKTGLLDAERIVIGSGSTYDSGYDPSTKETPSGAQSKADAAESSAKTYTDNNAEKKRVESDTAPGDTAVLWIDTSVSPNIVKYHNGSSWEKLAPTAAGEIGAETPAGAQTKADSAENNAKSYAQKDITKSATAPGSPETGELWLETDVSPEVLWRWNGSSWTKASPTQASDIGAETPSGAQTKADSAESNAKSHADNAASTAEANAKSFFQKNSWTYDLGYPTGEYFDDGESHDYDFPPIPAKYHDYMKVKLYQNDMESAFNVYANGTKFVDAVNAPNGVDAWVEFDIPSAELNSEADNTITVDRDAGSSDGGELFRIELEFDAQKYAEDEADNAESNAKSHADNNDTNVRDDLQLDAPLPSDLTLDASGVTASSSGGGYARLDYRGLYVYGGAIQIDGGLSDDDIASSGTWHSKETPSGAQSKADAAESSAKTYAEGQADSAESNAKSYADGNDTALRDDLQLDAPLPNDITMNANGITASASGGGYARLDYRGLYIDGGAIQVDGGIGAGNLFSFSSPDNTSSMESQISSNDLLNHSEESLFIYDTDYVRSREWDCTDGEQFTLSFYFQRRVTGSVDIRGRIRFAEADGTYSGDAQNSDSTFSSSSKKMVVRGTAPTGARRVMIEFRLEGSSDVEVNGIMFTRGSVEMAYTPHTDDALSPTIKDQWNTQGTYIDGNGVYTGTIEANQVNASTLSSITADIGTITAGTINGAQINGDNSHIQNNLIIETDSGKGLKFNPTGFFSGANHDTEFYLHGMTNKGLSDERHTFRIEPNRGNSENGDLSVHGLLSVYDKVNDYIPFNMYQPSGQKTKFLINGRNTTQTNEGVINIDTPNDETRDAIRFYENDTFGMGLGYDGSGSGPDNKMYISDDDGIQLINFYLDGRVATDSIIGMADIDVIGLGQGEVDTAGGSMRYKRNDSDYFMQSTNGNFYFFMGGSSTHTFYSSGTKAGGSIDVEGKRYGMSPVDSPQVLLEYIEWDVPLTPEGTKVYVDELWLKTVENYGVWQNNGKIVEEGADYFIIAGPDGETADCRIVGERTGYAGSWYTDMDAESEYVQNGGGTA